MKMKYKFKIKNWKIMKTRTTWKGLKKGQKFKVVSNNNSHNYPIGVVLTMSRDGECAVYNSLDIGDIVLIGGIDLIKDMKENIAEKVVEKEKLESEIVELEDRIKYCEDNDLTKFDEDEFKVFKVLETLKGDTSQKEKAKIIAKLIKNS